MLTGFLRKELKRSALQERKSNFRYFKCQKILKKMQNIIIVGAMANNFIKYEGHQIGKSIFEDNCETLVEKIFKNSKK